MRIVRALWLAAKRQRFEIIVATIAAITVSVSLAGLTGQLRDLAIPAECWSQTPDTPLPDACSRLNRHVGIAEEHGALALTVLAVLPIGIGALIGAALFSQELERRSVYLSWALDPARHRWIGLHLCLLLGLVLLLAVPPAILGDVLEGARRPYVSPHATFDAFATRGLPVVARALAAASLGAFWGAASGRALPGLVLGAVSATALFGASFLWFGKLGSTELLSGDIYDAAVVEFRYRERGSDLVETDDQVRARSPYPLDSPEYHTWRSERFEVVPVGYPGSAYPEIAIRQALLDTAIAAAVIASTVLLVRRRPMP